MIKIPKLLQMVTAAMKKEVYSLEEKLWPI